jgi:dihydroorotase (multifunctional complex type)
VDEGVIVAIGRAEHMPPADQVMDAEGRHLIPGAIDLHVHFRDPGLTYKEDFSTGSMAAAAGGVTTVYDMPNSDPKTLSVETLEEKCRIAAEKSFVNYAFYTYLADGMQAVIEPLIRAGLAGVKWDMDAVPDEYPRGYGSYKGYEVAENDAALEIFRLVARHGYNVGVHAEDMALVRQLREDLQAAGRTDMRAHMDSRPDFVEVSGMERAFRLGAITGCHVHIHHLSSRAGLELLKQRRAAGQSVSAEAGPTWMFFSADDYERLGALIRVTPAVKEKHDAAALWAGLRDGAIDCYATDHAPHSLEEKQRGWTQSLPGTIGVETSLPLLLDKVNQGELTLERLVAVACENPALIYKTYPRKGALRVGADADLVLLDMDTRWTIRNEEVHSKNHFTPFDGWEVQGQPARVWVRGHLVAEERQIVGEPGHGVLVNPKQAW